MASSEDLLILESPPTHRHPFSIHPTQGLRSGSTSASSSELNVAATTPISTVRTGPISIDISSSHSDTFSNPLRSQIPVLQVSSSTDSVAGGSGSDNGGGLPSSPLSFASSLVDPSLHLDTREGTHPSTPQDQTSYVSQGTAGATDYEPFYPNVTGRARTVTGPLLGIHRERGMQMEGSLKRPIQSIPTANRSISSGSRTDVSTSNFNSHRGPLENATKEQLLRELEYLREREREIEQAEQEREREAEAEQSQANTSHRSSTRGSSSVSSTLLPHSQKLPRLQTCFHPQSLPPPARRQNSDSGDGHSFSYGGGGNWSIGRNGQQGSGFMSGAGEESIEERLEEVATEDGGQSFDPVQVDELEYLLKSLKDLTRRYCKSLGTVAENPPHQVGQTAAKIQRVLQDMDQRMENRRDHQVEDPGSSSSRISHTRSYTDSAYSSSPLSSARYSSSAYKLNSRHHPQTKSSHLASEPISRTEFAELQSKVTLLTIDIQSLKGLVTTSDSHVKRLLTLQTESTPAPASSPVSPKNKTTTSSTSKMFGRLKFRSAPPGALNPPLPSRATRDSSSSNEFLPTTRSTLVNTNLSHLKSYPSYSEAKLVVEAAGIEIEVELFEEEEIDATRWIRDQVTLAIEERHSTELANVSTNTLSRRANYCLSKMHFGRSSNWWTAELELPTRPIPNNSEPSDWFRPLPASTAEGSDAWMEECLLIRRNQNLRKWKKQKDLAIVMKKAGNPPILRFVKHIKQWTIMQETEGKVTERDVDAVVVGKISNWNKLDKLDELAIAHQYGRQESIPTRLRWS